MKSAFKNKVTIKNKFKQLLHLQTKYFKKLKKKRELTSILTVDLVYLNVVFVK